MFYLLLAAFLLLGFFFLSVAAIEGDSMYHCVWVEYGEQCETLALSRVPSNPTQVVRA